MEKIKNCMNCSNCIPIGCGEHTCRERPGTIVLDGYAPGDDFMICKGVDFEEK